MLNSFISDIGKEPYQRRAILREYYAEGRRACDIKGGLLNGDCPYDWNWQHKEYDAWFAGWNDRADEIVYENEFSR